MLLHGHASRLERVFGGDNGAGAAFIDVSLTPYVTIVGSLMSIDNRILLVRQEQQLPFKLGEKTTKSAALGGGAPLQNEIGSICEIFFAHPKMLSKQIRFRRICASEIHSAHTDCCCC